MKRFWKWLKREPIVIERVIQSVRWTDPAEQKRRILAATPHGNRYQEGWRQFRQELNDYERCRHCRCCPNCGVSW